MEDQIFQFDTTGIMSCQRNRYPMLYIDKVTECVQYKYAKGYKLFSFSEEIFHENNPVVPESILFEAMLQMFLMTFLSDRKYKDAATAIQKRSRILCFYKQVKPGDRLDLVATCKSYRRGVAEGIIEGFVDGELVCYVEPTIIVLEEFRKYFPNSGKNQVSDIKPQSPTTIFDFKSISECVPQTSSWLFLDGLTECVPKKIIKAFKNFTFNEWYFPVHFPEHPNVPGFLQVETAIQAFKMLFCTHPKYKKCIFPVRKLYNISLLRIIDPGDRLDLTATCNCIESGIAYGNVTSDVGGQPAISLSIELEVS